MRIAARTATSSQNVNAGSGIAYSSRWCAGGVNLNADALLYLGFAVIVFNVGNAKRFDDLTGVHGSFSF
jgi:hypothetical protein